MGRVIVVGGGVAGLRCAGVLSEAGVEVVLLEGDDRVGGRVRTDRRAGYLLDRGFQVLPTSYPEARACLDVDALDLHEFRSGVLVRRGGGFQTLHHPLRHPGRLLETLRADVGTVGDRIRLAAWVAELLAGVEGAALRGRDLTSRELLARRGFSEEIVEAFFRPFFGGVFLEPGLVTAGRRLSFVLRTFATGLSGAPGDDEQLEAAVRVQLRGWFGEQVDRWRLLRVDRIRSALPAAPPGTIGGEGDSARVAPRLYVCGDHREHPSLEGALVSGRKAAEAVLVDL